MRFNMKYKTLYEKYCLTMSYLSYIGKLEQGKTDKVFNMY